jgi:hypothetical protein
MSVDAIFFVATAVQLFLPIAREINDTIGGSPSRSFGRIGPTF